MLIIHNFNRGGARGHRPMWLAEEMGLDYRVEGHDWPVGEAYRALNPLGSVPFLEDEDGVSINESLAMLLYIAERYGPTPLMPGKDQPAKLAQVLRMTVFAETELGANTLMTAHFGAPEAEKNNWSVRGVQGRFDQALAFVETQLKPGPYVAGAEFTLADIAVSTALGIYRSALGRTLSEPLAAYVARVQSRPAYQRAAASRG